MRIPSGTTDQYIYFVAVDDTDGVTRETGLSGFTVYRSRNGAAAAAMTTPTVNETDSSNMPGVYELLLDEDMTIASGNDSEEMVFHITVSGMRPVTRTIELYRPKITAGQTLSVAAGAVTLLGSNIISSLQIADSAAEEIADAVLDEALSGHTTAGTLGKALADVETDAAAVLAAQPTNFADLAISATTGLVTVGGTAIGAITANSLHDSAGEEIADKVLDEALSGHTTAGTLGKALADIETDTTEIENLNDLSAAEVNAEVLDVLNTDTFAEPTGVPPATDTLANKIGRVHMALRNQLTVTATKMTFYDDAGNPEWEKDLSDDDTTYTETEGNAV